MKDRYTTPEHLELLGIHVCPDCGKMKSIENSLCYGCGFDADDEILSEELLQQKYGKKIKDTKKLHLAKMTNTLYNQNRKIHIIRSGITLCNIVNSSTRKFDLGDEINGSLPHLFFTSPCNKCQKVYEND